MPPIVLRVEVSIPRAFYDRYATALAREAALRVHGLLPPAAQELRWRMDVVNAGYVLTYAVPLVSWEDLP